MFCKTRMHKLEKNMFGNHHHFVSQSVQTRVAHVHNTQLHVYFLSYPIHILLLKKKKKISTTIIAVKYFNRLTSNLHIIIFLYALLNCSSDISIVFQITFIEHLLFILFNIIQKKNSIPRLINALLGC